MRSPSASSRRTVVPRVGLGVLAAIHAITGGWALLLPDLFYRDFPGLGMRWIAGAPHYNEHLVTDFGGALLGIAVALSLAALNGERREAAARPSVAGPTP